MRETQTNFCQFLEKKLFLVTSLSNTVNIEGSFCGPSVHVYKSIKHNTYIWMLDQHAGFTLSFMVVSL